jgi:hypothetical protein
MHRINNKEFRFIALQMFKIVKLGPEIYELKLSRNMGFCQVMYAKEAHPVHPLIK